MYGSPRSINSEIKDFRYGFLLTIRGVGSLFFSAFHYISEKMYYLFERSLLAMVAGSRAARLLADLLGRSQILGVR